MLIQLKVHGLNGTKIIAIDSKSVARTIVQQPETQVTYELIDTETGVAPQSIAVKRNGNHLDITFEDSETVNLTIEDYYTKEPLNPVIGLAENGEYYLYLPESELPADSIALLNDQVVATEVLAGDPVTVFWLQSPDLFSYVGWSLASAALLGIGTYYTVKFNRDPKESDVNTATTVPVSPQIPKENTNVVDTSKADLALAELKAAKAAFDKALSDLLTRAGQNGNVITADDIALLEALRQRLLDAKNKAQAELDALGKFEGKDKLQVEIDSITISDLPAVTDINNNGRNDAQELGDAMSAVSAAEEAQNAYDKALESLKNKAINPSDLETLARLKEEADRLKEAAQKLVDGISETDEKLAAEKNALKDRLAQLGTVDLPAVTDSDSDGKSDEATEIPTADALLAAAREAQKNAEDKLKELSKDGLITPSEQDQILALNRLITEAKQLAADVINGIPDNGSDAVKAAKAALLEELNKVNTVKVPAVNDSNADGLEDDASTLVGNAEELFRLVEEKKAEIDAKGLISQEDKNKFDELLERAKAAKELAENKVGQLAESDPEKAGLLDRLNGLKELPTLGEVNDRDNDGINDETEFAEAEKALKDAEEAEKAAEDLLKAITADGIVTPQEWDQLNEANNKLENLQAIAYDKVKRLPNVQPKKSNFVARETKISPVDLPGVNADENGRLLSTEDLVRRAEELEANTEVRLLETNNRPTMKDIAELKKMNKAILAAKAAAKASVDALAAGEEKDGFNSRLDEVNAVDLPEPVDLKEAQRLVEDAEKALKALNDAIKTANEDGIISSDELNSPNVPTNLTALKEQAEKAKADAAKAIEALPDVQDYRKAVEDLEERTSYILPNLPLLNDFDNDGVTDSRERKQTYDLIEKAEKAGKAYEKALEKAGKDGLVTPQEQAKLEKLADKLTKAKSAAQDAINDLTAGVNAGKDEINALTERLQKVPTVDQLDLPKINDADSDGIADANSNPVEPAQKPELERAQDLFNELKNLVDQGSRLYDDITGEGNPVNAGDQKEILDVNARIIKVKAELDKALEELPDTDESAGLQSLREHKETLKELSKELKPLVIPAVTDLNGDGRMDSLADLIKAAETAAENATKLNEALGNDPITPEEALAVNMAIAQATAAKEYVKEAVNQLDAQDPNKTAFTERVDNIDIPALVKANDVDGDNQPDAAEIAAVREKVAQAKALAEQAAAKREAILEDDKVTPEEVRELDQLNAQVTEAKKAAEAAINTLPRPSADKATLIGDEPQDGEPSLRDVVNAVEPTAPVAVTADENGNPLDARALIEKAKELEAEAERKLEEVKAKRPEEITSEDVESLQALNDKIEAAKDAAQDAINEIDNKNTEKDDLNDELKTVNTVDLADVSRPAILDEIDNLLRTALEKEAEFNTTLENLAKAEAGAEKGLISQATVDQLSEEKQAVETAINNAKAKINELQDPLLQNRYNDRLADIEAVLPPVTDFNGDGISDRDELQAVKDRIAEVEAKEKEYEDQVQAARGEQNLITPEEKQTLDAARDEVLKLKEAVKAEIEALPNKVGDKAGEDVLNALNARLDEVNPENVRVNDLKDNGIVDSTDRVIEPLVKEFEDALKALKAKQDELAKRNPAVVTEDDVAEIERLKAAVEEARKAVLDALPEDDSSGKQEYLGRIERDPAEDIQTPETNDFDGDNRRDDDEVDAAEAALAAAKEALKLAEAARESALAPLEGMPETAGLVTLKEQAAVEEANKEFKKALNKLNDLIGDLPSDAQLTDAPDALKARIDALKKEAATLKEVPVPAVNDYNADNVLDSPEDLLREAEKLQRDLDREYNKLKDKEPWTQEDRDRIDTLNKKLAAAKEALENLIENDQALKDQYSDRLNALNTKPLKEVAKPDYTETVSRVKDLLKVAREKAAEAQKKADDAVADGKVKPSEQKAVIDANKELSAEKFKASLEIAKLPKAVINAEIPNLNEQLAQIKPAKVPAITADEEGNLLSTEDLVNEARKATQAAKEEEINVSSKDSGAVSPTEAENIELLKEVAEGAIDAARDAVAREPESQATDDMNYELDNLLTELPNIPAVNDFNGNNIRDVIEERDTRNTIDEAIEAQNEYNDALDKALDPDGENAGAINPDSELGRKLQELKDKADALRNEAKEKIDGLMPSTTKSELADKYADLATRDVPNTDHDNDGINDAREIAAIEDLIKEAEKAQREYDERLTEAKKDDALSPEDIKAANLEALREAAVEAKAKVQAELDKLDNTVGKELSELEKPELVHKLSQVPDAEPVPPVTDFNNNGLSDEKEIAAAKALAEDAQGKLDAYNTALENAKAEKGISDAENKALEDLHKAAVAAKALADNARDQLAQNVGPEKAKAATEANGDQAAEVPRIAEIEPVPAVDNFDDDTALDNEEIQNARTLAEQAKDALDRYAEKLQEAEADGKGISNDEHQELTRLYEDAATKQRQADEARERLPEDVGEAKAAAANIPVLSAPESVPPIDNYDGDENSDVKEIDNAQKLAEKAAETLQAYKEALAAAQVETPETKGISSAEHEKLTELHAAAQAAKEAADTARQSLPNDVGTEKAQEANVPVAEDVPAVPAIDNYDGDNKLDAEEIQNAKDLKAAADEAHRRYEEARDNAGTIITKDEHDNLTDLFNKAEEAKRAADDARQSLPQDVGAVEAEKAAVGETQDLKPVPEINDYDGDGTVDDVEIQKARDAVANAKTAIKAYEDKLKEAVATGLGISAKEGEELAKLHAEAVKAKEAADAAREALPTGVGPTKANDANIEVLADVPALAPVDNYDNDNLMDDQEIDAARKLAEAAQTALDKYKAKLAEVQQEGEGVAPGITKDEYEGAEGLAALHKAAQDAKKAADAALDKLPTDVGAEKATAAGIPRVESAGDLPEISNYDADAELDETELENARTLHRAAEEALAAYKAELTKANTEGVGISKAEQDRLKELKATADETKRLSDQAIDALESGVGPDKAAAANLDKVDAAEKLPAIDNYDGDEKSDTQEINEARTAATNAENALNAYTTALAQAKADNRGISKAESDRLKPLHDVAVAAKAEADKLRAELPEAVGAEKAAAARVPEAAEVPAFEGIDNYDGDELLDEAEITNARNAQKDAAAALQDYNTLLETSKDGGISKLEHDRLTEARQIALDAKKRADDAKAALPRDVGEEKATAAAIESTQDVPALPAIDNYDGDTKLDSEESAEITRLLDAAQAAKDAYNAARAKTVEDTFVSPQEMERNDLLNLKRLADNAVAAATKAIEHLETDIGPEKAAAEKPAFEARLNTIIPIQDLPKVNDFNDDGKNDDGEKADVEEKLQDANTAHSNFITVRDRVLEDNLVNPTEEGEVRVAKRDADDSYRKAENAIRELPSKVGDEYATPELIAELRAQLPPRTTAVPGINDIEDNGVEDVKEDIIRPLVAAVEDAKIAADAKARVISHQPTVTPKDVEDLAKLNEALKKAVDAAMAEINKLPTPNLEQHPNHTGKQEYLNTVNQNKDPAVIPDVNDQDADGIKDADERQAVENVEAAIEDVKEAIQAHDNYLNNTALTDNTISPDEARELERLRNEVANKRGLAQDMIDALPQTIGTKPSDVTTKEGLQDELNKLSVPEEKQSNDFDNDGTSDEAEIQAVKAALDTAKAKQDIYEQALARAKQGANGELISRQEAADEDLAKKKQDAQAARTEADNLFNEFSARSVGPQKYAANREEVENKFKALHPVAEYEVNDFDGDSISDTDEVKDLTDKIQAALTAKRAYEDAVAAVKGTNDVVSQQEITDAELNKLRREATDAARAANNKFTELARDIGTDKATLAKAATQDLIDEVNKALSPLPRVNDIDNNGINDTDDRKLEAMIESIRDVSNQIKAFVLGVNAREPKVIQQDDHDTLATMNAELREKLAAFDTEIEQAKYLGTKGKEDYLNTILNDHLRDLGILDGVNDRNNNNKLDSQDIQDAEDAIKQLIDSHLEYENALVEAKANGAINPNSPTGQQLARVRDQIIRNKDVVKGFVEEVPESMRGNMIERIDGIFPSLVPNNDSDNDGRTDAAEEVFTAPIADGINTLNRLVEDYNRSLAAARDDKGTISPQEARSLEEKAAAIAATKQDLAAKVSALPRQIGQTAQDNALKADFESKLNAVQPPVAPTANDRDDDGKTDAAEDAITNTLRNDITGLGDKIEALKAAIVAARQSKGTISPQEERDLAAKAAELTAEKAALEQRVNNLPTTIGTTSEDSAAKAELERLLRTLNVPETPRSNDDDDDGITNEQENNSIRSVEAAISSIQPEIDRYNALLARSQQATGSTNGQPNHATINPSEAAALKRAEQAVQDAIDNAQRELDAVRPILSGNAEDRATLQRLTNSFNAEKAKKPTAPESNDFNNDGESDAAEIDAVRSSIATAKQKQDEYLAALNTARRGTNGNLISDAEERNNDLAAKKQAADEARQEATRIFNALESQVGQDKASTAKGSGGLQTALNALRETPYVVDDFDGDAISDTNEITRLAQALRDATDKKAAFETALARVSGDGVVSSQEVQAANLVGLRNEAEAAINAAKTLFDNFDQHVGAPKANAEKPKHQSTYNALSPLSPLPNNNDSDGDGITDVAEERAISDMQAKVDALNAALTNYNNALRDAGPTYNQAEANNLANLARAVQQAKDAATAAVNGLPQQIGTLPADNRITDGFRSQINGVTVPVAPAKNDDDNDGITNAQEDAAKARVTANIDRIKAALADYNRTKADADANNPGQGKQPTISPEEARVLKEKEDAVQRAIDDTQRELDALPAALGNNNPNDVTRLTQQFNTEKAKKPTAPEANDFNNDGETDPVELTKLDTALREAAAAKKLYDDARAKVMADGAVTQDEITANRLEALRSAAQQKIDAMNTVKNGLPQEVGAQKAADKVAEKQAEIDALTLAPVPSVTLNDRDKDGISDETEAEITSDLDRRIAALKRLVETYEADRTAAMTSKNTVSPAENSDLTPKRANLITQKDALLREIDGLLNRIGTTNEDRTKQTSYRNELNKINPSPVPAANDRDDDGKTDVAEQNVVNSVNGKITALETARSNYDRELAKAQQDDWITNQEHTSLTTLAKAVKDAKDAAVASADILGNGTNQIGTTAEDRTTKAGLDSRINAVEVPEAPVADNPSSVTTLDVIVPINEIVLSNVRASFGPVVEGTRNTTAGIDASDTLISWRGDTIRPTSSIALSTENQGTVRARDLDTFFKIAKIEHTNSGLRNGNYLNETSLNLSFDLSVNGQRTTVSNRKFADIYTFETAGQLDTYEEDYFVFKPEAQNINIGGNTFRINLENDDSSAAARNESIQARQRTQEMVDSHSRSGANSRFIPSKLPALLSNPAEANKAVFMASPESSRFRPGTSSNELGLGFKVTTTGLSKAELPGAKSGKVDDAASVWTSGTTNGVTITSTGSNTFDVKKGQTVIGKFVGRANGDYTFTPEEGLKDINHDETLKATFVKGRHSVEFNLKGLYTPEAAKIPVEDRDDIVLKVVDTNKIDYVGISSNIDVIDLGGRENISLRNVTISNVKAHNDNHLYIKGSAGDSVKLGTVDQAGSNTQTDATGVWTKGAVHTSKIGGGTDVSYDTWRHTDGTELYIQQGIQII